MTTTSSSPGAKGETETGTAGRLPPMRSGDIFRWQWREGVNASYWCKSMIAIVTNRGDLRDTYWGLRVSDDFSIDERNIDLVHLTFVANLDDLDRRPEYEGVYFDDADIVNLNHANSTRDNFYIRKGAKRSLAKMREVALYKLEKAKSDKCQAEWDIERLTKDLVSIEAGNIEEVRL